MFLLLLLFLLLHYLCVLCDEILSSSKNF